MRVLIACEESQRVCIAFRDRGHRAYSCDLRPASGGYPGWHIREDALEIAYSEPWDLMIGHPPCTYLSVAGNRWRSPERDVKTKEAYDFFMRLWESPIPKICLENPVGKMSTMFRPPDQYVQPYWFGDPYAKKTGLWLKNLPKLEPTNLVTPEPYGKYANGKNKTWAEHVLRDPILRSKTPWGLAYAMAQQWG